MRPDLDKREWPVPPSVRASYAKSPVGGLLDAALRRAIVTEGYVMAKELSLRGSLRPIPPGECAITSLALSRRVVYGATSGRAPHVFAYFTAPAGEAVADAAVLEGHTAVRNSLVWLDGCGLYAGTSAPGRKDYAGGEVVKIERPLLGDVIQEWGGARSKTESLGIPVAGEGIACMIGDAARGRLFGLTDASGTLFSVHGQSGKIETHGLLDEIQRFSPQLILGPDGLVYGCGTAGRILRFDPEVGKVEETGMFLPSMAGRGQYSYVGAWALDARSGLIYAGDVADGLLSELDVRSRKVRVVGKPTAQPHVRALVAVPDGRIYGITGRRDTPCHLFCYTPSAHEMRDLGVMTSGTELRWYGFEFDCAVAGPDGRVYFGESERVSHLFVYFPPMLPVVGHEGVQWDKGDRVRATGVDL